MAVRPWSARVTRAELSSTASKEMLPAKKAAGNQIISLRYRIIAAWSVCSPLASATGHSEATLTSIRPWPSAYMSRARATATGPARAVPAHTKPGGCTE